MSVTREQAATIALAEANRQFGYPTVNDELVIIDKFVKESSSAWAFPYNTRSSVETGDYLLGLIGNGPIVVAKATGLATPMSSLFSCEEALEMFQTGDCKAKPRISPAELAEICLAVNPWWPGQPEEEDGLPPRPPKYTPGEWAEFHRDPCGWCIKELQNSDPAIRFNAADILRGLAKDAEAAIPALIAGFRDVDEMVRAQCVFAMVEIGYVAKERAIAAVPPLTSLLGDNNPEVRSLAIAALEGIGPAATSAIPQLRQLLDDSDPETRERASAALRKFESYH